MQTLETLNANKLKGYTRVKLSENIKEFPKKLYDLADTLEILDLSHNCLSELPEDISRLKNLKILFLSNNNFTRVPPQLKSLKNLYMLGLKANNIKDFDEDILPLSISWLILTDNKIEVLPESIGKLKKLQKCALAGNRIKKLPQTMSNCKNLELLRLSANKLEKVPTWLLELPKLAWLALSGNRCSPKVKSYKNSYDFDDVELFELLGQGASGEIYRAKMKNKEIALKLYKGDVTSDGYASDEIAAYLELEKHPHLIDVLGSFNGKLALALELIPKNYTNLGFPPDFTTCTRDTFEDTFSIETIYKVAKAISSVGEHFHKHNLMHGDLYAHNILINEDSHCYLGDFGAASFYEDNELYEKIELRAYGCLLDDLLSRCEDVEHKIYKQLSSIRDNCMSEDFNKRASFKAISEEL